MKIEIKFNVKDKDIKSFNDKMNEINYLLMDVYIDTTIKNRNNFFYKGSDLEITAIGKDGN